MFFIHLEALSQDCQCMQAFMRMETPTPVWCNGLSVSIAMQGSEQEIACTAMSPCCFAQVGLREHLIC